MPLQESGMPMTDPGRFARTEAALTDARTLLYVLRS